MASNRLRVIISGETRELNQALQQTRRVVDDTIGQIVARAQEGSIAFGALAAGGGVLVKSFLDASVQMSGFRATLTGIMGDSAAAETELKKLADFAASTPFELPSVVKAGVQMRALGVDVNTFLPLAGNLAAVMGRDIPDAALAVAKAASGNQDGIQILADSYGIARKELEKFGAATKADGSIDVTQIERLQTALRDVIASKYGTAMQNQAATAAGAFSNLGDTIGQIKAQLGAELEPAFKNLALALTGILKGFNDLSPAMKGMIAQTALVGTGTAAFLSVLAGGIAAFKTLQVSVQAYTAVTKALAAQKAAAAAASGAAAAAEGGLAAAGAAAATSQTGLAAAMGALRAAMLATPFGPVLLAIGALAGGAALLIEQYSKATAEAEAQTQAQAKVQVAFHKSRQATLEAVDALRQYGTASVEAVNQVVTNLTKAGKTDADVQRSIAGILQQQEQAAAQGNQKQVDALEERLKLLRAVRMEMSGTEDARLKAAAKADEASKKEKRAQEDLLKSYQEKAKAGVFASNKEELAALDNLLAKLDKQNKAYQELSLSRVKLARDAAKEEAKAAEDARKKQVEEATRALDLIVGNDQAAIQKRIAILEQLKNDSRLNADERHRIEVDLARETQSLEKSKADAAKAAEQAKVKAAEAASQARQKLLQAELTANETSLTVLQDKFSKGENVLAQIEEEIAARDRLLAQLEKEKSKQDGIGKSASTKAALRRAADAEIANQAKKTELELGKIRETQQKRDANSQAEQARQKAEAAQQEEDRLKATYDLTQKNGREVESAMQRRQQAEREALINRAAEQSIGASTQEQATIRRDLELQLADLAKKQTEEARKLKEELKAQTDEKTKQAGFTLGNVSGVDGAGDFSAFDVNKPKASSQKPIQDLAADQAKATQISDQSLKIFQQMLAELQKIRTEPVKINLKQTEARSSEEKDWRTSTNKTGS